MSVKPDDKIFRGPFACPDTALWVAVLVQALRDVQRPEPGKAGHSVRAVVSWVGTQDFYTACNLAGAEPTKMETQFRRAIEERSEENDGMFDGDLSAV